MAEFTSTTIQTVEAGQNLPLTETAVKGTNCIVHRAGAGNVTLRGRVHVLYPAFLHQGAKLCRNVALVQLGACLGRYQPLAAAVHHPKSNNLVNRVENRDNSVFTGFRFLSALHIPLLQMHVIAAHGKQFVNAHTGV